MMFLSREAVVGNSATDRLVDLYDVGITSGQFITTSAEVTPNGGLVRESPPKWP